eukprot:TRINITY_DN1740_c0_g1_i2.p1 TRINITY_DN1740_c0_g1~~TRINITY_DN1740_c0_g1_i2.p1  ORF type:complete len:1635 (-),score=381.18 TRINITY_DN1740_c0_g1_i2:49-4791(-)
MSFPSSSFVRAVTLLAFALGLALSQEQSSLSSSHTSRQVITHPVSDGRWYDPIVSSIYSKATLPPPRLSDHSAVCTSDGTMHVFGGWTDLANPTGAYYTLNVSSSINSQPWKWATFPPKNVQQQLAGHTSVLSTDHRYVVHYGGKNDLGTTSAVYVYDTLLEEWYEPDIKGLVPPDRFGHSAIVTDDNIMVVYGGQFNKRNPSISGFRFDVAKLDLNTFTWLGVQMKGPVPYARFLHSAIFTQDRGTPYMVVFGGNWVCLPPQNSSCVFGAPFPLGGNTNDVYFYNTDTDTWDPVVKAPESVGVPEVVHHQAVVSPAQPDVMLTIGGLTDRMLSCKFNITDRTWISIVFQPYPYIPDSPNTNMPGSFPVARSHHSMCTFQGLVIIYGGRSPYTWVQKPRSDFLVYDTEDDSWVVPRIENYHPERAAHSVAVTQDSRLIVFGGVAGDLGVTNEVLHLNLGTSLFEEDDTPSLPGALMPIPTMAHAAVMTQDASGKDIMFVFGGQGASNVHAGFPVWSYDVSSRVWSPVDPDGSAPNPRSFHQAVYFHDRREVYIFGGKFSTGQALSDLVSYNIDSNTFTALQPTGDQPPARLGHVAVATSSSSMFVFGGRDETYTIFDDMYQLDLALMRWTRLSPNITKGSYLYAMLYMSAVFLPRRQSILIMGGTVYNTDSGTVFEYSTATNTWTMHTTDGGVIPFVGRDLFGAVLCGSACGYETVAVFSGRSGDISEAEPWRQVMFYTPERLNILPAPLLETRETGTQTNFSFTLNAPPSGAVLVTFNTNNTREGVVVSSTLQFDTSNWQTPQHVVVQGVPDALRDGDTVYGAYGTVTGPDPFFSMAVSAPVPIINRDVAWPAVLAISPAMSPPGGGLRATISGQNFLDSPGLSVFVNGEQATEVVWISDTQIAFTIPPIMGPNVIIPTYVSYGVNNSNDGTEGWMRCPGSSGPGFDVGVPQCPEYNMLYVSSDCPIAGQWGKDTCMACPNGAICPGGFRVWPKPGFWNPNEHTPPTACIPAEACPGHFQTPRCSPGYAGDYCASCADSFYRRGGVCVSCLSDQTSAGGILVVVSIFFGLILMGIGFLEDLYLDHFVTALLTMQQLVQVGSAVGKFLSPGAQDALSNLSVIFFDFQFIRPGCTIGTIKFYQVYLSMIAIAGVCVVFFTLASFLRSFLLYRSPPRGGKNRHDRLVILTLSLRSRLHDKMKLSKRILLKIQLWSATLLVGRDKRDPDTLAPSSSVVSSPRSSSIMSPESSFSLSPTLSEKELIGLDDTLSSSSSSSSPSSQRTSPGPSPSPSMSSLSMLSDRETISRTRSFWGQVREDVAWTKFFKRRCIRSLILLFCILYFIITFRTFQAVSCVTVKIFQGAVSQQNIQLGSQLRLLAELSTECYSGAHLFIAPIAWILLLLYCIGYPVLCLVLITRSFKRGLWHPKREMKYGYLYRGVRGTRATYWVRLVPFAFSIMLAAQSVAQQDGIVAIFINGLVFLVYAAFVILARPFVSTKENFLTSAIGLGRVVYVVALLGAIRFGSASNALGASSSLSGQALGYFVTLIILVVLSAVGLLLLRYKYQTGARSRSSSAAVVVV